MLVILMFSYRQTIKAYPSAGGAYIVTKDNLGLLPAQVAGVALLTDYILTVAVSVSAGVAAMYSAFPALVPLPGPDRRSASSPSSPGATCGGEGVGPHVRRPDLRLPRLDVHHDRRRASLKARSSAGFATCADPRRSTSRSPSKARLGARRRRSWCCTPSPPAARP